MNNNHLIFIMIIAFFCLLTLLTNQIRIKRKRIKLAEIYFNLKLGNLKQKKEMADNKKFSIKYPKLSSRIEKLLLLNSKNVFSLNNITLHREGIIKLAKDEDATTDYIDYVKELLDCLDGENVEFKELVEYSCDTRFELIRTLFPIKFRIFRLLDKFEGYIVKLIIHSVKNKEINNVVNAKKETAEEDFADGEELKVRFSI